MSMMFHHHPDGYVRIVVAEVLVYESAVADFHLDCQALGLPAYAGIEATWIERQYLPGIRHTLSNSRTVTGDAMPWETGEAYIGAAARLAEAKAARLAPPPSPPVEPDPPLSWGGQTGP